MALDLERREHKACQADLRKYIITVNILYRKLAEEYERNDVLAKGLQRLGRDLDCCHGSITKLYHDLYEQHMRGQQSTSTPSRRTFESHNDFDLGSGCQAAESTAPESVGFIKSEDTSPF